ncbi:MAG: polysaccharide deacetylase family protein [Candidatus Omnitrophota bacterium]
MKKKIIEYILNHNDNIIVIAGVTLLFPAWFLRNCLGDSKYRKRFWNGTCSVLTISFDCDYSKDVEAIPDVLKILKRFDITTSFACVGYWIEKFPEEHKMILEYGHEIVNHTYSHPDNDELTPGRKFKEISYDEKKEEIEKCHNVCKSILKYQPVGCRIPHFKNLFTPDIYKLLNEIGYKYSSSTCLTNTKSKGMPFLADNGIVEFPLSTCPRHPFTVFDTWHSFNSPKLFYKMIHRTEKEYIHLFKLLVNMAIDSSAYINIYLDPYDVVRMKRFSELLDFLKQKETDIRVARYIDVLDKGWIKQ